MPSRKSSRRAFLKGAAATDALADAVDALPQGSPSRPTSVSNAPQPPVVAQPLSLPESYLLRLGRRAMACEFEVLLNAGQYAHGPEAALAALDLVDQLEAQLTVYRESSEVSRLNRAAFEQETPIEPRLFALLWQARQLHEQTAGAYDITSGPLTKIWGFYRRAGRLPTDEEIAAALERVGSQHFALDAQRQTVRFLVPGLEINLGSIGKGYALDRCAELLLSQGIKDFFIHGGQSSILARGAEGAAYQSPGNQEIMPAGSASKPAGPGWVIGVRHPLRPAQSLAELIVRDRAVGTSGAGQQFFFQDGRRFGHILDPRTGRPAEGILSTTVLAPTAAEADALSTALFVMGVESALEFCRSRQQIAALIVTPGANAGGIDIYTPGLAAADWRLLDPSAACKGPNPIGQPPTKAQNC